MVALLAPGSGSTSSAYLVALGARGVALRSGSAEELGVVIALGVEGRAARRVRRCTRALAGAVRPPPLDDGPNELLSAREREVLACLAQGRSNREIAATLSVTLATVKSHLVRIYAKLEASNRNEALGRAVALGLLSLSGVPRRAGEPARPFSARFTPIPADETGPHSAAIRP